MASQSTNLSERMPPTPRREGGREEGENITRGTEDAVAAYFHYRAVFARYIEGIFHRN